MTKKEFAELASTVVGAIALVLVAFGVLSSDAAPNEVTARGVSNFDSLTLGNDLVVQTPFGDSGHTTFFISSEQDFKKYEEEIVKEKEVKIMKRINCRGAAIEACVTRHGTGQFDGLRLRFPLSTVCGTSDTHGDRVSKDASLLDPSCRAYPSSG